MNAPATLWFHRSNGEDLLVTMDISDILGFVRTIYDISFERGILGDMPLFNHSLYDKDDKLTVPEQETDLFSHSKLQVILAPEGFQPEAYMYSKIFVTTPEAALHILTGLPSSQPTEDNNLTDVIDIECMEEYIFLKTAPGYRYELPIREEPYDITQPWKTEQEMDEELENYMSMPVTP